MQAGVDLLVFANQQVYDPEVTDRTLDTVAGLVRSGRLTEERIDQSVARVDQAKICPTRRMLVRSGRTGR